MSFWDSLYKNGSIHTKPSREIIELVPYLRARGVSDILDVGCGTGRHSIYLSKEGFNVKGIDVSEKAIQLARGQSNGLSVVYETVDFERMRLKQDSFDFILANHSLEYGKYENIRKAFTEISGSLKQNKPFFARVASDMHTFAKASPEEVYGFSHIGFCIKNNMHVHFFTKGELCNLFKEYDIERLEHVSHEVGTNDIITVPLNEWVILASKNSM